MDIGKTLGGLARTVAGALTGGLSDRVIELVENVTGEPMPPEKRAELKAKTEEEITKRQRNADAAANEAARDLTNRIGELEGTASDLKAMPVLGPIMLFLRGAQRPVWGFGVLYIDIQVFSKNWPLDPDTVTQSAFWIVNLLVLGFLFGERALKNVLPFVGEFLHARGRGRGDG